MRGALLRSNGYFCYIFDYDSNATRVAVFKQVGKAKTGYDMYLQKPKYVNMKSGTILRYFTDKTLSNTVKVEFLGYLSRIDFEHVCMIVYGR